MFSKAFKAGVASVCLAASWPAASQTIVGRVVKIADGDTLTVLTKQGRVRVRLSGIDAPEKHQVYGETSRKTLKKSCFGKPAVVDVKTKGRYRRVVGRVFCAGVDANAEQVRLGSAWVYGKYARDPELYRLERAARLAHRGLWALPDPTPPWVWRRARRQAHYAITPMFPFAGFVM